MSKDESLEKSKELPSLKNEDKIVQRRQEPEISYDNLTESCQGIKQEFLASLIKWTRGFQESEKIDMFFEKRVDELIQEAENLEDNLTTQKNALKAKLKQLTKTLTQVVENES